MRSFFKIFITVVVLAGGFVAYLWLQPPKAVTTATSRPAVGPLVPSQSGLLVGEGRNAWVRQFDAEGRLSSRFRAAQWEPAYRTYVP